MPHQAMNVKWETVAPCMTCRLCHKLFRDATTIIECLHTFCRKCIRKKLSEEEMKSCPICNTDLGCVPLGKLRENSGRRGDLEGNFRFEEQRGVPGPSLVVVCFSLLL